MKVLLALDDSSHSALALENVLARPWTADTQFMVLTVLEPFHPDFAGWEISAVDQAMAYAERQKADAGKYASVCAAKLSEKFGGERVSFESLEGRIKETIIQAAIDWQADLLIMGSHGRTGIERFLLGSVSQAVVSHAPCSVEIVKKKGHQEASGA